LSTHPPPTEIHTLSLHDALPIFGKTAEEIEYALSEEIHSFNCESEAELALIDSLAARRGVRASFSLRVNPDVDAKTHPYISTGLDRKSTRLNSSHVKISYAVFCL